MVLAVFVFLLVVCLLLSLARLWRLSRNYLHPSHFKAGAVRTTVHRLLKPRTPLDCPSCRLACTPSPSVKFASAPVRPWREVKSRRGAPKRIPTDGFACPNPQCPYVGISDASIHALVGDGKHGHVERIQTFRGPACRTTFTARRHTPLYRLKTPSHQVAMVRISRWPKGWTLPRLGESSAFDKVPSPPGCPELGSTRTPCTSASSAICTSRTCCFDELRTRLRCATQVLWLAIDPLTKILPVLQLGPRTQTMAHVLIHSLRQSLAAFLPSALHQ
jgi:hypothetical protein